MVIGNCSYLCKTATICYSVKCTVSLLLCLWDSAENAVMKRQSRGIGSITELVEPFGRGPQWGQGARFTNRWP